MSRTAGIIGGGIGGLATAIMLARAGWTVRVFERAARRDEAGTALGMWAPALAALDALELGSRVRELGARQRAGALLRPDGSRIATVDVEAMARRSGESTYLLSRPVLLRLLTEALPPGLLHFDAEITDPAALAGRYDVLVGADGISSRTRTALFGTATRPRYAGSTAWRGTVDGATDTGCETWGRGLRFGITPREDGRTNWYATVVTGPDTSFPDGDLATLRHYFGGWHPAVRRVVETVRPEEILHHDLYDLDPPLPSFVRGNVVLIGDAAHAMTPDLGRGACEALIDAVALGRCLAEQPDVARGLAAYDRQRRRPTQRLVRLARTVGRIAQARRFTAVRDATIRAAVALAPSG